MGLSYPPTAVSTFSSLCQGLVGIWKSAGQVKENCCWKQERNRKIKENAFNLSTITVLYQVQQNFECFFVSQGPAFIHSTARVAGSQQTLIAQRPKAATYKQGHSSSHGKGNGLWPWSLITPLLQCYKVIREALWQTPALTYMCGRAMVMWSAIGTEGQVRWADKRWTEHSLSRRWKQNSRFTALSYGLCYSLNLQSESEEFMWMRRWAALKGVTKEMAQGRWECTREGGRGR